MNAQKRKSPDRKKGSAKAKGRQPALFIQAIYMVGSFAARYPRVIGGGACFAIIFGFVSANALWYQPGGHPSPFLRTRDVEDPNGIPGYRLARPQPPADVTTFRIERADDSKLVTATPTAPGATAQPNPLVADIQRELTRRGLYDGAADGVIGTRTEAAILFFEQTAGLPQSGAPTAEILVARYSRTKKRRKTGSLRRQQGCSWYFSVTGKAGRDTVIKPRKIVRQNSSELRTAHRYRDVDDGAGKDLVGRLRFADSGDLLRHRLLCRVRDDGIVCGCLGVVVGKALVEQLVSDAGTFLGAVTECGEGFGPLHADIRLFDAQ